MRVKLLFEINIINYLTRFCGTDAFRRVCGQYLLDTRNNTG